MMISIFRVEFSFFFFFLRVWGAGVGFEGEGFAGAGFAGAGFGCEGFTGAGFGAEGLTGAGFGCEGFGWGKGSGVITCLSTGIEGCSSLEVFASGGADLGVRTGVFGCCCGGSSSIS
jgi:hypothetical protein